MSELKAYLHVVYAGFGDASILEFHSGGKRQLYLVDGGPVRYVGAGGTQQERIKKLTKLQLSRPYYQYLLYTLTGLARIPNSTGIKLDGAVVTHPHADHLDGVERLFRELLPHQYQDSIKPDSPDKRLMCNGPVLLTRKFAQKDEAYRSFSEFLLTTKFEISLDKDDIQNAFVNDIIFTFPSSPGVLYQRQKPSEDDEPFSEEKQRNKLKGGDEDDNLNKSSIILYTEKGGKICLSGDAYGYDIIAMLRKQGVKNLDIFKLPHHGSRHNSILGTVLPPPWVFQNLASMLLLSLSLNMKTTFDKNPEEESDIDYLCDQLKRIDGDGNGEKVQQVAEAFLKELTTRIKNLTEKITPEVLLRKIQEKHIEIVSALEQQPGQIDPCKNMKPLKPLEDWQTLRDNVSNSLTFCRFPTIGSERLTKARKIDLSNFVGDLMGNNTIYRDFFAAKIGMDRFFELFDSKTYYVSASGRYDHPSADVIKGIMKAAVKKKKPCRIVFTSGGAVPSKHLPDVQEEHYKEWNKLVSLYYLKSNVSFKLDPSSEAIVAPIGTVKFENDDKVRIKVAAQLKKNFGFTIPRRSFLSTLDKYYVKTEISDKKIHWLQINPDGTLFLTSTKSDKNVLFVSNAPSINGDLRMITLKSESKDGGEKNAWLEKATKGGFLVKCSPHGDYLFVENGFLKSGNEKNKASSFFFDHKTFSGQMKSGKEVPIVEFLRSFGYKGDEQSIHVRSVLEILLGVRNMKLLIEELPDGFIGIVALDHRVNLALSTVELSSSLDCEVVSSHIEVMIPTPSMTFDKHKVTQLQVLVKEPCSNSPRLSLLISTSLRGTRYTVDLSGHLKPKQPSVDMYLNALGGVPLEGRNDMTLGTLLERVMGLLPLETLSDCFQTQLLAHEIFTWKVDCALSTVNYFMSPVAVEVLSGDVYLNIPHGMQTITFANSVTAYLSSVHVMVSDPRTYKSDFAIECDASIGSVPVSMRMARTSTSIPEVIINFPENVSVATVVKTLDLPANLDELKVPLVNKVIKNLVLSKPRISVVQDVLSSKVTRISSVCFDFSFDKFPSVLPSSLPLPKDSRAVVSVFYPLDQQLKVGVDVEFNLPLYSSASSENYPFLNSKFSLRPVEIADQDSQRYYSCSISLWPSTSGISVQSALQAVGLGELTASMTSSVPCISSMLSEVQLDKVTLEANPQMRSINSLTLSLFVPEFVIISGKLSIHEASLLVQYHADQWYAETEMKLLVFNKFVCHAAFSLPRLGVPGSLTFRNTEASFTLKEFVKGIGVAVVDDIPIIEEVLDVKISRVALTCENDDTSFKLTKAVTVLEKRTLTVGSIKLCNLELEVCYANIQGHSSVSFSLQGYLNPKTHASLAYNAEKRELLGRYVFMENISTSECLNELFYDEVKDYSSSNAFDHIKSLHVQEVKVVLSFPGEKNWNLKEFALILEGTLSLGPFHLKRLRLEYVKDQADTAKWHISVLGHFKSEDLSFKMELSCSNRQQSESTIFKAVITPDSPGGVTLSSLLQLTGLMKPEVPQIDGSPNFLDIQMEEALLQFEVSPFRIRKADVVVKTTGTLKILEKPVIQVHEARLEYHFDETGDSVQTETFIAGVFIIAKVRLDVKLRKDTARGLVMKGHLQDADNIDFEQAAEQLSPEVPFSLPKNVSLTSFLLKLESSEETTSLQLEGESHTNWSIDAGFSTITVENLGGKLSFKRDRMSDAWTGFVCLTGKVLLVETIVLAVEVYHDSNGETLAFGTVHEPEKIHLDLMTQKFAVGSDSSKSWNELVPGKTESSIRSPKFNSASLLINFSSKTLFFYGNVVGFGTGLLMVKKTGGNENSTEYGFLFGLYLGSEFRFSSLNKSLSVVDEILSVQQANLSVISMEHLTVEEICHDFSKLQRVKHKQQELNTPLTDLDIESISKVEVGRGVTAFAKVTFSGEVSKLLSNVSHIQRGEKFADIVLFARMAENAIDTVFMAQIKEMKLFGGNLTFDEITFTYQPSKGKAFTLNGNMSLTLTDDSHPILFRGSLEISEFKADFSMTVGGSSETIPEPFGMFGISIEDPKLQLSWKFDQDKHHSIVPSCSIHGTVNFVNSASSSEKQSVTTLSGAILFQEGKPMVASISLDFNHPLSIDDIFVTLFEEKWPSGYLDISFKEGEIYCAKANVEVDGRTYKEGFHGRTEIQIFGNAFGVEVSVDKRGMAVKGYTKFEIDLVVATLTDKRFEEDKGPEIEISSYDDKTKFELSTGVKLLQEKIGSCAVGYDVTEKCFLGSLTYDGELLGTSNPSIEFEWSKESGFKIRKWPAILNLQEVINFAKAFEELSQMIDSPCEKLVGLAFDKVIKTKCRLNIKQASTKDSGNPDAWLVLRLQGKLDIMMVTDEPSVTIDFPEMIVAITKPSRQFRLSDLPGFLISEIGKNSLELAKQVFTQPKELTKFMAALGSIKLSRKVLSGLICRGAHSPNVTNQAASELESMEGEAASSESALETSFEELTATAGKAAGSIAELAAGAVSVISQVGVVVGALVAIISFIAGIISFFTGKSKEQKEAEERRKEAERKGDRARKLVEDRLVVLNLSIALLKPDEVEVSWKALEENVKYSVSLTRVDMGGVETVLLTATTENNKVSFKGDEIKYNTKQFTAYVHSSFEHRNVTFQGREQSLSKSTPPLLRAPSKLEVESKQEGREIHVTFSQVEYAVDYKTEVLTHDDKVIGSAIVKRPSENKNGSHVFRADELTSGVPGKTRVRVCARGEEEKLNEFKYSNDLYLVAAPSGMRLSYEPQSQQLSVKWKVKDAQKISSFYCEMHSVEANEVVFSKGIAKSTDDSLESNLIIPLSEISDKTKSPYRIRVCSLGVEGTLASAFASSNDIQSFLPHVNGITPTYDPKSNQLAVSWVSVTGATKYKVTITEESNISRVVGNLTSTEDQNKVVFDMGDIQLESGVKYVVKVAAEGSDALHLPGLPSTADNKFAQLQSPVSVSQEYLFEERKIKVTFKPVPLASAHLIEVFNEAKPTNIPGKYVYPVATGSVDWPSSVTYSFDVESMILESGGRFKSRVTAQGNPNWINSPSCESPNAFQCGDAPISVALKYSIETSTLMILISSRPGHFVAKLEDTFHKGRTISTQQFIVKRDTEKDSVHQTSLEIPLTADEKLQGAIYQAFVQNTGDRQFLPCEIKQSNKVKLLDPPKSVTQELNDSILTVTWKCVQSASGYHIRVYNKKTGSTASEMSVTRDLGLPGKDMQKETEVDSLSLDSNGLYETVVTVQGDEVNIGGASRKSKTTIPSCPSPEDVQITYDNGTRHMVVQCSSVKDGISLKLGVVNADKLSKQKTNIQGALMGFKEVAVSSSDVGRPVVAKFDDSVLIASLDGKHSGVAQMIKRRGETSLPSRYSISVDEVAWLKPAVPIHLSFDPASSTLKVSWTKVNLALSYSVEILQKREGITLIPFSDGVLSGVLSSDVNMENVSIEKTDKFIAKVQPSGSPGTVITRHAVGYSSETLVCENSPTDVDLLQVEDEKVNATWKGEALHEEDETGNITWKGDVVTTFQLNVWKMLESGDKVNVASMQTDKPELISTSKTLSMVSPGRYIFGVRAQGSINKLHSVYSVADFVVVIMDAPVVKAMLHRPAVTVQWTPVDIPTQDFSCYVISYRLRESHWNQVEVEMSATEKTIEDLQPDSEYLFCISVASFRRGRGIRSPFTPVYTDFDDSEVPLPVEAKNLLENPNFKPVRIGPDDWEEQGYTYDIVTEPWKFIEPGRRYRQYGERFQYRVETVTQGTDDWPGHDDSHPSWCIAASGNAWRFQIIDLREKGLTEDDLDEKRPDIEVWEWFAVKRGGSGAYDIKVSLLDSYKRDLTGRNFFLERRKFPTNNGSWERLGHTFANYPPGLRFIRFEDGMQCQDDTYDVKAFGATVKISESPGERVKYSKDCERAVNDQINLELHASLVFLAMSCCKYDDPAVNELLSNQSDMCFSHAHMFMQYQRDREADIVLQDIRKPDPDRWATGIDACEAALQIAGEVNDSLVDLRRRAREEHDHHLVDFISANLLQKQVQSVHALFCFLTNLKTATEAEVTGH